MLKTMLGKGALVLGLAIATLQAHADLKRDNTALVVVEFQKQWTEPGLYNWLIKDEYESRSVLDNTLQLLAAARASETPVIQAPLIIDPENKKGWFGRLTFGQIFKKGSTKAEFTDGILGPNDHIVTGRYGFDGFVGSNLEATIQATGAKNLLFCGFTTEHCVDMTMDTARQKGYNVWLIPECTATKNAKLQRQTEAKWHEVGGVIPLDDALQLLQRFKDEHHRDNG